MFTSGRFAIITFVPARAGCARSNSSYCISRTEREVCAYADSADTSRELDRGALPRNAPRRRQLCGGNTHGIDARCTYGTDAGTPWRIAGLLIVSARVAGYTPSAARTFSGVRSCGVTSEVAGALTARLMIS